LIGYIRTLIDVVANLRAGKHLHKYQTEIKKDKTGYIKDYEEMLVQSENNVRNLIKTQHQMKLLNETLKNKIEELDKSKNELKKENRKINEVL
jgi:replicative DNA helicase